jgi:carboxysome shell carbonic anhydrase
MPRRTVPTERPQAPTAPRRRPGVQTPAPVLSEASAAEPTAVILRGTRARAAMQQARSLSPTGSGLVRRQRRQRPAPDRLRPRRADDLPAAGLGARGRAGSALHPLTDAGANVALHAYNQSVKERFDRIVPVLKRISALQHDDDFVDQAQRLARQELGYDLPLPILETAWVSQLDMRSLFAWCVFEAYEQTSIDFFSTDPLAGRPGSPAAEDFESFLLSCGFHLFDVTPCADGRLAHAIAFALRLPFSSVRRRPHAGALFDVENTVNRWVRTEHQRYREGVPNPAHADTRYLKVVLYHFSSLDPTHQGCAAHGSDDVLAASCGLERLRHFREAVENSFCCGASVDLLLMGLDTDTDAIRVHVPGLDGSTRLDTWLDARDVYAATQELSAEQGRRTIEAMVQAAAASSPDPGMVRLVSRLLEHNLSQIDYVRERHHGHYGEEGHAERFIGVGIGFKEIHLRNLTYFAHLDTLEEGAPDLDVGVKIFKGLNVSRGLPIPVVLRFDYHGQVPGARDRALRHAERVLEAIRNRYADLCQQGLLHALISLRDRDSHVPAETVASTITFATVGGH